MQEMEEILQRDIFPYFPAHLRELLAGAAPELLRRLVEIRLRIGQPLLLAAPDGDYFLTAAGEIAPEIARAYFCTAADVEQVVRAASRSSLYALEEELRRGYITVVGGHRIGLAGQAVLTGGTVKTLKNFSSLNIRLAREVKGCARQVLPRLFDAERRLRNTLLVSPPRCGKTTLLRDIVRLLSTGGRDFPGMQVGVVDERSEIAACRDGKISSDLGYRVDVLDGCPKAAGMLMLIRSMAPQVIVTDEIGRAEDVTALEEALHAGVRVIATAHGDSLADLERRPHVRALLGAHYFDCYVFLSDRPAVGAIREIIAANPAAAQRVLPC